MGDCGFRTVRGSMDDDRASRMSADRERELVSRAREDGDAFVELYHFYVPRIYGFIFRRVRDHSVAEDLTSVTFQKALENVRRSDFRNETFGGWLYRVASNAVVDHFRRARRNVLMSSAYGESEPADLAMDAMAAALDRDEVRRALERLPDNHREVIVLRFYDDLEVPEICAVLGCSRAVFSLRLHRAIRALRLAIAKEASDVA
jgi:RNA polymerase sigma-70 factor (ECF subfamily)